MSTAEGQLSFERQVAAFLGSMAEEIPSRAGNPPRAMLGRARIRTASTIGTSALLVAGLLVAAALVVHALNGRSSFGLQTGGEPTYGSAGVAGASTSADSLGHHVAAWLRGPGGTGGGVGRGYLGSGEEAIWFGQAGGEGGGQEAGESKVSGRDQLGDRFGRLGKDGSGRVGGSGGFGGPGRPGGHGSGDSGWIPPIWGGGAALNGGLPPAGWGAEIGSVPPGGPAPVVPPDQPTHAGSTGDSESTDVGAPQGPPQPAPPPEGP
jgi:hypothetical protein